MKKVEAIKNKRQTAYMMQRLRKGKEIEDRRDIREVQRDLSLIRAPHAGESSVLQLKCKSYFVSLKNWNFLPSISRLALECEGQLLIIFQVC